MEGMALDEGHPPADAARVGSPAMQAAAGGGEGDAGTAMDAEGPGAAEHPADAGNAGAGPGGGDDDGRPWVQCDACGKWRRLPGVTEATGYWECSNLGGDASCGDPCSYCNETADCKCKEGGDEAEEGWVTVGQRVPLHFETETRYRRGSCMPWLLYKAYCPKCDRRSGNLDRRLKLEAWLEAHGSCVPEWAGLRAEDFSWKLDGLAREAAKAVKQYRPLVDEQLRELGEVSDDDYYPDDDARISARLAGRSRGGSADLAGGEAGGAGGGPADDWTKWPVPDLVRATEDHLLWLLRQEEEEGLAALGARPWPDVLDTLQSLVTQHPPAQWQAELRKLMGATPAAAG